MPVGGPGEFEPVREFDCVDEEVVPDREVVGDPGEFKLLRELDWVDDEAVAVWLIVFILDVDDEIVPDWVPLLDLVFESVREMDCVDLEFV